MELFSEIYNSYYTSISKIIDKSQEKEISNKEIEEIIKKIAFEESHLFIMPKIKSKTWDFFDENNKPKIENKTTYPLTKLQKMWLCSIFNDDRIKLFFENTHIKNIKEYFEKNEIKPLFNQEDFYYFDQFKFGDNYLDEKYILNFKKVIKAIKSKEVLYIEYNSNKDKEIKGDFRVIKIEYSEKNNRHRVYAVKIVESKEKNVYLLNIDGIKKIDKGNESYEKDILFEKYIDYNISKKPIVLEISNERNALERFMVQFSSFNKKTHYDTQKRKHICYIYYNKSLETEILIQILSFGPLVKVIGHEKFLKEFKLRISKQKSLMKI